PVHGTWGPHGRRVRVMAREKRMGVEAASKPPEGCAPGYRDGGNTGRLGGLTSVGHRGYNWSSATDDIGGLDLIFSSQALGTDYSDDRANGFPLRCLSE
uniref:hypothetical protein n=3 Tax=uncultured Rikenella sp. TaxID=368003 RepID=UPI00272D96D0